MSNWYRRTNPAEVTHSKRWAASEGIRVAAAALNLPELLAVAGITPDIKLQWFSRANGTERDFTEANLAAEVGTNDKPFFCHPKESTLAGQLCYNKDGSWVCIQLNADKNEASICQTAMHEVRHLWQFALERQGHIVCKEEDDCEWFAVNAVGPVLDALGVVKVLPAEPSVREIQVERVGVSRICGLER